MDRDEREKALHRLAFRIREEIMKSGASTIGSSELDLIWQEDHQTLPDYEKRMRVKNFSAQFGFAAMIDFDLSRAVFIISD